jgi:hypothetical protein
MASGNFASISTALRILLQCHHMTADTIEWLKQEGKGEATWSVPHFLAVIIIKAKENWQMVY